ncbi:hypothetical protein [Actinoalloteichus spitiensis]|uniref:hypothetical protein n=1 Tax=Actinoalloteichus spitiensis TaxID=252394 RepID=UPI0003677DE1|nr:hypothetical protein [Actinoalloteichus spitiensis]
MRGRPGNGGWRAPGGAVSRPDYTGTLRALTVDLLLYGSAATEDAAFAVWLPVGARLLSRRFRAAPGRSGLLFVRGR